MLEIEERMCRRELPLTAGCRVGEVRESGVEMVPLVLCQTQSLLLHSHQVLLRLVGVSVSSCRPVLKTIGSPGDPPGRWPGTGEACLPGELAILVEDPRTELALGRFKYMSSCRHIEKDMIELVVHFGKQASWLTVSVVDIIDAPAVVQDLFPSHLHF